MVVWNRYVFWDMILMLLMIDFCVRVCMLVLENSIVLFFVLYSCGVRYRIVVLFVFEGLMKVICFLGFVMKDMLLRVGCVFGEVFG